MSFLPAFFAPVIAFVGFPVAPFLTAVGGRFLRPCGPLLAVQAGVGLLGFYLHTAADLRGPSPRRLDDFIEGEPALAPLLFPNLVLLAAIGLRVWGRPSERDGDPGMSTDHPSPLATHSARGHDS